MTSDDESRAGFQGETTCPVTGLAVERRPEWTEILLAPNHTVDIEVIGRRIIHSRPAGYASAEGVAAAADLFEDVVEQAVEPDGRHVHLANYSDLQGASANARRAFAAALQRRRGLTAVVVYGASPTARCASGFR